MSDPTVILLPLARMQTPFYIGVARRLAVRGVRSAFVSFHEPSLPDIERAGFQAVSFFGRIGPLRERSPEEVASVLARFGIENPNRIISHERAFYGTTNGPLLLRKFAAYLEGAEAILEELRGTLGPIRLVQELGGFLGVASAFFAARRLGIDNTFIEPSFFRGRVALTLNTFAAPRFPVSANRPAAAPVRDYLEGVLRERRLVIPAKDARSYRSASRKILDRRNLRRLVEKTVAKYLRSEQEEFSHIASHVGRHLRMVANGLRLGSAYRPLEAAGRFFYYPLHVPADVALTVRSPEYLDQFALLDFLARNIPVSHTIAFKEHPAMVGAFSAGRTRELLRQHSNAVLLRPDLNNLDVMRAADGVVTVNSKSGAEALLMRKPVVVLGDAFYRNSSLVTAVDSLAELPAVLRGLADREAPSEAMVESYFQAVWDGTSPGELFVADEANCDTFATSLAPHFGSG